jgi:sialic acid synthase SpsE
MKIKIGSKFVGDGCPCYIVAEVGINHNGQFNLAKKLIDVAKNAGADAVKFQKRDIDSLLTKELADRPYYGDNSFGETYGEHRRKLELSEQEWRKLFAHSKEIGIDFFASAWDKKSADFLDELGVPVFKIPSADVTNLPLIEHICRKNKPIILSTGMTTLEEIDEAMEIIRKHNMQVILLHCISAYPFDDYLSNLNVIHTLKERYNVPVGYSGHEKSGHVVTLGAVVLGVCMVERHFTIDHLMPGPDHAASLEPLGLAGLVEDIRKLESAFGDGKKSILECESLVRAKLTKSIVTTRHIKAGEIIRAEDLTMKSPGTGLKAKYIPTLVGKKARQDMERDTLVPKEALEW